jgi:hypothetical protein
MFFLHMQVRSLVLSYLDKSSLPFIALQFLYANDFFSFLLFIIYFIKL